MARLRHIALSIQDLDKSAKFFVEAFDMKISGTPSKYVCYVSDGTMNVALLAVGASHWATTRMSRSILRWRQSSLYRSRRSRDMTMPVGFQSGFAASRPATRHRDSTSSTARSTARSTAPRTRTRCPDASSSSNSAPLSARVLAPPCLPAPPPPLGQDRDIAVTVRRQLFHSWRDTFVAS